MKSMRHRIATVARRLALGLILCVGVAQADDEAREWLSAMNAALATRNYQGEFLHLANGHAEKLRILHRVKDGRVAERLLSLSGRRREIVRSGNELQCFLADERKVIVDSNAAPSTLLGTLPAFDHGLEANYRVDFVGRGRSVTGREARILAVTPRDGYRFGYRLWIDADTKMPVRTDLCDSEGRVLEQVLFTDLHVGAVLPDAVFKSEVDATGFVWVRAGTGPVASQASRPSWQLGQLPPGFSVRSAGEQQLPGSEGPVMHLVVSDGLASVSVFIEGPPAPPRRATEGQGRVGSAFAYSRVVAGHQVTAVGEVPPQTVEFIASGVSPGRSAKAAFAPAIAPGLPSQ